jgi:hypothetical protein
MMTNPHDRPSADDPRRLRTLLERAHELAQDHQVHSVLVGLAGFEGDQDFPDLVDYVVSALRIDDAVLRLTRERAIVLLSDADAARAREVMGRVVQDYRERFPSLTEPAVSLGFFEVLPEHEEIAVKDVLPHIFRPPVSH